MMRMTLTLLVDQIDGGVLPLRDQTLTMLWPPPPPFYIHHNYEGTDDDDVEEENDDDDNAVAVPSYPS